MIELKPRTRPVVYVLMGKDFPRVRTKCRDGLRQILIDGIEMVTTACQTVNLDSFAMKVNNATTSVKDVVTDLSIYTDGKNIIVETSVAQRVIISDVAGHAYTVDVPEGRTVIPARNSGVVVVCAGDKTAKLMIK